ncbi:MAG: hypothetical protein IH584_03710 [Candidatus Aminicenantes bacterium]|nr:hypothetical protein [Candidatus Aminicenantes bacterium]
MKKTFWIALAVLAAACFLGEPVRLAAFSQSELENMVPEGFKLSVPLQYYGTAENKMADGSIFDYMDGGGVVYLERGFREMVHGEYRDQHGNAVVLDIFSMTTSEQAQAALNDERICPPAGTPLKSDFIGVAHRFPPDYYLYFCQGNRLVYLHVSNDALAEMLKRFAVRVQKFCAKENK